MSAVREESGQLSLVEEGADHFDVHQMGPAQIRDVHDVDVTRRRVFDSLDDGSYGVPHDIDEVGQTAGSLDDHVARGTVVNPAGTIESVRYDG